jgi:branched-chain amino acid transport system permease protein
MGLLPGALTSGLALGALYALVAVGFTLVFKAGGALNFAQSTLMIVAAYICVSSFAAGNGLLAIVIATVVAGVISGGGYLVLLRSFSGRDPITITIITMGVSFVMSAVVDLIWHGNIENFNLLASAPSFSVGDGARVSALEIVSFGITLLAFAALIGFFRYSAVGARLRAAADSPGLAMRSGINVSGLYALAWGLSGAVAGLSGALLAASTSVSPGLGDVGLSAFPAAVLGGFGSVGGSLVGGLGIGIAEQLAVYYINPTAASAASYVVMLIVLLVRPTGLFGERRLVRA